MWGFRRTHAVILGCLPEYYCRWSERWSVNQTDKLRPSAVLPVQQVQSPQSAGRSNRLARRRLKKKKIRRRSNKKELTRRRRTATKLTDARRRRRRSKQLWSMVASWHVNCDCSGVWKSCCLLTYGPPALVERRRTSGKGGAIAPDRRSAVLFIVGRWISFFVECTYDGWYAVTIR